MRKSIIITSVIGIIAYSATWVYLANRLQTNVEHIIANARSHGYEITHDGMQFTGYPFQLAVVASNPKVEQSDLFKSWIDGDIRFSASLWSPNEITSVAGGEHHIVWNYPAQPLYLRGQQFKASLFALDPSKFSFAYDSFSLQSAGQPLASAKSAELSVQLNPEYEKTPKPLFNVAITLQDLSGNFLRDQLLGDTIQKLKIQTTMSGELRGQSITEMFKMWVASDGSLEVANLELKWGDLNLRAEGTFAMDESLQPLAAFSADVQEVNKMLDTMVKTNFINKKASRLAKLGLKFLATPVNEHQNRNGQQEVDYRIAITVQDGNLSVGAIPILKVPKINWSSSW